MDEYKEDYNQNRAKMDSEEAQDSMTYNKTTNNNMVHSAHSEMLHHKANTINNYDSSIIE